MNRRPLDNVDCWADWILRFGFGQGQSLQEARALASGRLGHATQLLDLIVQGKDIEPECKVLDVGAGLGQLALEARRRVGARGLVAAVDISHDALRMCRTEARIQEETETDLGHLVLAVGDGVALPFGPETFDQILTRSVLIYIRDKAQAAHEFSRVLRSGGRVSMYEPINKVSLQGWPFGTELPGLEPEHSRVIEVLSAHDRFRSEMCSFDEQDLINIFDRGGFSSIALNYRYSRHRLSDDPEHVSGLLEARPNPGALSIREAAETALGDGVEHYMARLRTLLLERRPYVIGASAILNATREK